MLVAFMRLFWNYEILSVENVCGLSDVSYLYMQYPSLDIYKIAQGLGRICRFAGNCKTFWPVLMHSLVTACLVPEPMAIHALLHDAAEICIGDIPAPFKNSFLRDFEDSTLRHIYKQLGLSFPSPEIRQTVKAADIRCLIGEVWTVGPDSLKELPEFHTRDPIAEELILEMLDGYNFDSVLNANGKYVLCFLERYFSLYDLLPGKPTLL